MGAADFWNSQERAQEVVGQLKSLKAVLKPLEEGVRGDEDLVTLVEMAQEEDSLSAEVAGAASTSANATRPGPAGWWGTPDMAPPRGPI